jgi:hypothetical protein
MDSAGCLPPKTIDSSDSDSAASSLGGGSSTEDVDPGAAASSWWSTPSFYPQQPRQQAPTRTGMGGLVSALPQAGRRALKRLRSLMSRAEDWAEGDMLPRTMRQADSMALSARSRADAFDDIHPIHGGLCGLGYRCVPSGALCFSITNECSTIQWLHPGKVTKQLHGLARGLGMLGEFGRRLPANSPPPLALACGRPPRLQGASKAQGDRVAAARSSANIPGLSFRGAATGICSREHQFHTVRPRDQHTGPGACQLNPYHCFQEAHYTQRPMLGLLLLHRLFSVLHLV